MGSAPSTTRMARNSVSGPLGLRKPGGCTTTGFALGGLSKKDPAITIPIENVTDFLAGHLASDHKMITSKLWPDIASKLQAPGRWSRVFGPLSSAIATLLDFDWAVPSITHWVSPDGAVWELDFSAPNLIQMVKKLLLHYFQASLWKKAAIFPSGLAPDLTDIFQLRRAGLKASSHREVYWLDAVVQGSMEFSLQHLVTKAEGYVRCSLCGASLEGPVLPHFAYGCQVVANDFDNESIQATNHFAMRAFEDISLGIDQAFWLRGLTELKLPDPFSMH